LTLKLKKQEVALVGKIKNRLLAAFCLAIAGGSLLFCLGFSQFSMPSLNMANLFKNTEDELTPGTASVIKDENGAVISQMSRRVYPGDEIITAEGRHYRVKEVAGNEAKAVFIEMDQKLLAYREEYSRMEVPVAAVVRNTGTVGIYHSHTDESYLPSDGTYSIPFHGGIIQVGDSYKKTLSSEGTKVYHDTTPHDPHDNNAYYRSRRTAAQLMKKDPIALFDVHRDGIDDPEFYRKTISNEDVSQMRLVIGRENPRMSSNLDFARRLMAYANKTHYPIAKEIFIGKGNYNQDLLPTSLLIEAGTYTNRKEEAMRGISLLADAVPAVLGIGGISSPTNPTARHPGSWSAVGWILLITVLAGGAFLLTSAGGWNEAKNRLSQLISGEFADLFGRRKK